MGLIIIFKGKKEKQIKPRVQYKYYLRMDHKLDEISDFLKKCFKILKIKD